MGTYTEVLALPCSPDEVRRATVSAAVANFGVRSPKRAEYPRQRDDPDVVLGRVLMGFSDEADVGPPWVVFDPDEVVTVRAELQQPMRVLRREIANDVANHVEPDVMTDWGLRQLSLAERVFAHAARHRGWVVSVFEGDRRCFEDGGMVQRQNGDGIFSPTCVMPRLSSARRFVPLGAAALLLPGLALAGWRYRRMLRASRSG